MESDSKAKSPQQNVISEIQMASKLVKQLETVEQQYESIINKLPSDCSQIEQNSTGLFMIAPGGQQHPILANCVNQWTTIQRRHDGSVDFNRSWDEYSQGKKWWKKSTTFCCWRFFWLRSPRNCTVFHKTKQNKQNWFDHTDEYTLTRAHFNHRFFIWYRLFRFWYTIGRILDWKYSIESFNGWQLYNFENNHARHLW